MHQRFLWNQTSHCQLTFKSKTKLSPLLEGDTIEHTSDADLGSNQLPTHANEIPNKENAESTKEETLLKLQYSVFVPEGGDIVEDGVIAGGGWCNMKKIALTTTSLLLVLWVFPFWKLPLLP